MLFTHYDYMRNHDSLNTWRYLGTTPAYSYRPTTG